MNSIKAAAEASIPVEHGTALCSIDRPTVTSNSHRWPAPMSSDVAEALLGVGIVVLKKYNHVPGSNLVGWGME